MDSGLLTIMERQLITPDDENLSARGFCL